VLLEEPTPFTLHEVTVSIFASSSFSSARSVIPTHPLTAAAKPAGPVKSTAGGAHELAVPTAAVVALRVALPGARIIPGPIGLGITCLAAVYLSASGEHPKAAAMPFVAATKHEAQKYYFAQAGTRGFPSDSWIRSEYETTRLLWQEKLIRSGYSTADAMRGSTVLINQVLAKAKHDANAAWAKKDKAPRPPADRRGSVRCNSRKQAEDRAKAYSSHHGGDGKAAGPEKGRAGKKIRWHFDPLDRNGKHIGPHFWFPG